MPSDINPTSPEFTISRIARSVRGAAVLACSGDGAGKVAASDAPSELADLCCVISATTGWLARKTRLAVNKADRCIAGLLDD
jgi:hypothetical protein